MPEETRVPRATPVEHALNLLEVTREMKLADADRDVRMYTDDGCGKSPSLAVADLKAHFELVVEDLLRLLIMAANLYMTDGSVEGLESRLLREQDRLDSCIVCTPSVHVGDVCGGGECTCFPTRQQLIEDMAGGSVA